MLKRQEMYIELNAEQKEILKRLQTKGKGYIVGGFLRDHMFGVKNHDCDFATNLPLNEVVALFDDKNPKIVGEKFNVVLIDNKYEIARLRVDLKCYGNRKNVDIKFTNDLEEDLKRRDFTINALAYDGKYLYWVDELDSINDIKYRKLRFVGNPIDRIKEDPLRILRLIRFMQTIDNAYVEESLIKLINEHKGLLKKLSIERIRNEYVKILSHYIKWETKQTFLFEKVEDRYINKSDDWRLQFAYILKNYNYTIDIVQEILKNMKFSKVEQRDIVTLYKMLYFKNNINAKHVLRYLSFYNLDYLYDLLYHNKDILLDCYPFKIKSLNITVDELLNLGVKQNQLNKVQNLLLDYCLTETLNNKEDLTCKVNEISQNIDREVSVVNMLENYLLNIFK